MTTDLWMLVATGILCMFLPLPMLYGRMVTRGGLEWAMGNREEAFEFPSWVGRAERAHRNMVENVAPFAILVLVAHVSGHANGITAIASTVFFLARFAHGVVYIAGIVGVRTVVFFIGRIAEVVIFIQLFR